MVVDALGDAHRPAPGFPDPTSALGLAREQATGSALHVIVDDLIVGAAGLTGGVRADGSVEIWYALIGQVRGRGYGSALVALLRDRALALPGACSVVAEVDDPFGPSARALARAGFERTATRWIFTPPAH
jgi:RimJ/RimL family protein N-acetyltransferase